MSGYFMPHNRTSNWLIYNQAKLRSGIKIFVCKEVENKWWGCNSMTSFCGLWEIRTWSQPIGCRQHRVTYAEIVARPLARRRDSTARPPFVDMRARKPCFLARLRTFGWKVRFVVIVNPFLLPFGLCRFGRACLPNGATVRWGGNGRGVCGQGSNWGQPGGGSAK